MGNFFERPPQQRRDSVAGQAGENYVPKQVRDEMEKKVMSGKASLNKPEYGQMAQEEAEKSFFDEGDQMNKQVQNSEEKLAS